MPEVVATITLAEAGEKEEALNERLEDMGFVPTGPQRTTPAAWSAVPNYAKGAQVTQGTQVYRSVQAANKNHEPSADADFTWWAPVSISTYPSQNPAYTSEASTSSISYLGGWQGR